MKVLCVIPARGGSKGIPRKNIITIGGKPLIYYTIKAAQETDSIDKIIVSTDNKEIADIAKSYGAQIIRRPRSISGDTASSESAIMHSLQFLENEENYIPDLVVFLQATSPIRQLDDIQNGINHFIDGKFDSLFSAYPLNGFVWRVNKRNVCSLNYDFKNRPRRQNAPIDIIENGSIYIFKPLVLKKYHNRLGGKIGVYIMHSLDSFQIDDNEEITIIEKLLSIRRKMRDEIFSTKPRLLVFDFDGVMTDNSVIVNESGSEAVICDRGDGLGIQKLRETNIELIVLSTEVNTVVEARCNKLKIKCIQGCDDKLLTLKRIAKERSIHPSNICYVGNDLNDLDCMKWVDMPIAVDNAVEEIKSLSSYITKNSGGKGAVREICELFLKNI